MCAQLIKRFYDVFVTGDRGPLYWDPMQHIGAVFAAQPRDGLWAGPDATFQGKWAERNWRNVPGPFYGAMTDNCWVGRARVREWITTKHRRWIDSDRADEREAASGLADYLAYLDGALQGHLRIYSYFVDNHISPATGDRLPSL